MEFKRTTVGRQTQHAPLQHAYARVAAGSGAPIRHELQARGVLEEIPLTFLASRLRHGRAADDRRLGQPRVDTVDPMTARTLLSEIG